MIKVIPGTKGIVVKLKPSVSYLFDCRFEYTVGSGNLCGLVCMNLLKWAHVGHVMLVRPHILFSKICIGHLH